MKSGGSFEPVEYRIAPPLHNNPSLAIDVAFLGPFRLLAFINNMQVILYGLFMFIFKASFTSKVLFQNQSCLQASTLILRRGC